MASDDFGGCIGGIILVALIAAGLFILVVFVIPATIGAAALLGGGSGLANYVTSFVNNIRPERDDDGKNAKTILISLGAALFLTAVIVIWIKTR